jgi:hypothetical protein
MGFRQEVNLIPVMSAAPYQGEQQSRLCTICVNVISKDLEGSG